MPRPTYRVRRLVTLIAVALALGVAAHGVCQAIEHHDGVKDAVVLCAAALALAAGVTLLVRGRGGSVELPVRWIGFSSPMPAAVAAADVRTSAAWLQRFQN